MTLKTHKPAKVAADEQTRMANGSLQYLVEGRDDPTRNGDGSAPITRGNTLSFMICGEEGFKLIAKDLWEAKGSADIVCWGFDPAMELDRTGDTWPRGLRYGDLLTLIATRDNPVKVRLLIWYDQKPSFMANNMPGFTDHIKWNPTVSSPYDSKERQDYCVEWWAQNLPGGRNNAGGNKNLQVTLRSVGSEDVKALLAKPIPLIKDGKPVNEGEDARERIEEGGLELAATHHQKPILIDYDYDEGSKAIGYVMGLNSVTDYWDRTAHEVDDPLREVWTSGTIGDETKHQTAAEGTASKSVYKHSKPYQDYACRIQGPSLAQLKYNFENGWATALGQPLPFNKKPPAPAAKIKPVAGNPAHLVQILRTQAHEGEKSIKEVYFQAASNAYNYIYIENQYFFYPEFARHLKETRANHRLDWSLKSGKPVSEMPKLYVFIVIPHPERDQMIPRTYDMLTELGDSASMPEQGGDVDKGKLDQSYGKYSHKGPKGGQVLDRPSLQDLEQTLGLEVSVARLRTSGSDANGNMAYREIYIHSKLMIIDDAFITLGSANLNQRSMSVDSEINIAATGQLYAGDLRQRVFALHSGGDVTGGGDPATLAATFNQWNAVMVKNARARKKSKSMSGFLLQFEDHRSSTTLLAENDIPPSNVETG